MTKISVADRFFELYEDKQIKILKEILEIFNENNSISPDIKQDIFNTFSHLIEQVEYANDLIDIKKYLIIFKKLPDETKKEIIKQFLRKVEYENEKYHKRRKVEKCAVYGHAFGKWEKFSWTTTETAYFDREIIPDYEVRHKKWCRECKKCGYKEESFTKPQELIDEEKVEKIKRLEKEIKKLKGE